jgi:hypothetical protein
MMMLVRERLGPVSMTGIRSVWTVVAMVYPLLIRHGSGRLTEGAGLPVQDRRGNYRIVRVARVVVAVAMDPDYLPLQGDRCSRSQTQIGQQLHSLVKPSSQPVSPILPVVPGYLEFWLHFAFWLPENIPCSLLHWHVRQGWDLIDQMSLLKDQMQVKIRLL